MNIIDRLFGFELTDLKLEIHRLNRELEKYTEAKEHAAPRLCSDCKYFKCGEVQIPATCNHPRNGSVVNGLPRHSCSFLRSTEREDCAVYGKWWEAKA